MPTTSSTTNRDDSTVLSIKDAAVAQNSATASFATAATASATVVVPDEGQDPVSEGNTAQEDVAQPVLPNAAPGSDDEDSDSEYMFFDASEEESGDTSDDNEESEGGLDDIWTNYSKETLPHQKTTKAEALLLLLVYVVTAGLTWTQIEGLLVLVNQLLGETVFPQTKYKFRKLWKDKMDVVKLHYFCQLCHRHLSDSSQSCRSALLKCTCPEAKETKVKDIISAGSFFMMFNLRQQITDMLTVIGDALFKNLKRLESESYIPGHYSDITDGNLYRSIRRQLGMKWSDITLTFNTDGAAVFKSSKSSVWPLQVLINELPVQLRWKNIKVAGLWFAKEHPPMHLFLTAFVKEVENIGTLVWSSARQIVKSSAFVILCCVDSPARADVLNMKRFNGYYGCPWCLEKGTIVDGKCYKI